MVTNGAIRYAFARYGCEGLGTGRSRLGIVGMASVHRPAVAVRLRQKVQLPALV